jgi:hypothetical protein
LTQARHRGFIAGVAGKLKTAQPFDRHNRAVTQQQACRAAGIVTIGPCAVPAFQPDTRAANGTRHRLRMKAPVGGILILGAARFAQVEGGHGRIGAIVGNGMNDRKTWPAMRAVRKRITVTPVRPTAISAAQSAQITASGVTPVCT